MSDTANSSPNESPQPDGGGWQTLYLRDRRLLTLTICLIIVAGTAALFVLPRMEDPVLTGRAAIINTFYPGAGAARVESLITEKIEAEIEEVEEIKELRSVSRDGVSTITIELLDSVGPDEAGNVWSRIRDRLGDARPHLPREASEPKFDKLKISAYAVIVALCWEPDTPVNYAVLRRYSEELDNRLRAIGGTKEVDVFGDPDEEIQITLRPEQLTQRQLTVADVAAQLQASDARVAAGQQHSGLGDFQIEMAGELDSLARIRRTPIQFGSASQTVALGDIADVRKSVKLPMSAQALVDGKPAITVSATVLPTQRVDRWFDEANRVLDQFANSLPTGVSQQIRFEQNTYVRGRLRALSWNLLLGALAVVAVIGVMMGWRSALVVGMALPLASLMVLAGLNFLGIPLHQMSITGLIIALGLLIDNAIVTVDEVGQKLRQGASRAEAVRKTINHLGVPLFGSTLTTALSFAPIALMPGPAGEFVGSIAISVLLAIFSSFVLAMTLTPALAALSSGAIPGANASRRWYQTGVGHPGLAAAYHRFLAWLYQRPTVGIGLSLVVPVLGFYLGTTLTEQFFPPADRDQLNLQMTLPASSSLEATREAALTARQILLQHEEVVDVDWYLGQSAPSFYYNMLANQAGVSQYAQALVQLNSAYHTRDLIRRLQAQLDQELPHARVLVRQLEQGPPFAAPIEVRLAGTDLQQLQAWGNQVRRVLAGTPQVVHATSDLGEALPTLAVDVDEEQARISGMTQTEIARQLEATLEGSVGGLLLEQTEELPVRVRSGQATRSSLEQIASINLMARPAGAAPQAIPLTTLADVNFVPKVPAIKRFNRQRINEIRGYINAGELPAAVLADFQARLAAADIPTPPGCYLTYAGEASKRNEAVGNLMSNVFILIVIMIATLVLSFSSYRIAGIVGAVAVLSVGLSLGALATFGYPFGFMAIIGTMGLIGVAINDTIVVLAAIREHPQARAGDSQAIADVVLGSTRHVLATTFTTIAGFMPLLLAGGGFWPPLATAISGGVSGATILALIFGPSCYRLLMCPRRCVNRTEVMVPTGDSLVEDVSVMPALNG